MGKEALIPENTPYASLAWVRKANTLIQMNRYISDFRNKSLSLMGQKLIAMAISKIPADADPNKPIVVSFPATEFWDMCGVTNDSGANIKNLKDNLMQLKTSATWVWTTDESGNVALSTISWATNASLKKVGNRGMIEIEFDPKINQSLLNLTGKFTAYPLQAVMRLRSKYGFSLYELICSYEYEGNILEVPEEKLIELLDAESYKDQPNKLSKRVLDIGVQDINDNALGLQVEYERIKKGANGRICIFVSERTIDLPVPKQPVALLNEMPIPSPPPKPKKKNDLILMDLRQRVFYEVHKAIFSEHEIEIMDKVLDTVRKVMTSKKEYFAIAGKTFFASDVKEVFQKFDEDTMLTVIARFIAHEENVEKPEAYLRTSIYREIVTPSYEE